MEIFRRVFGLILLAFAIPLLTASIWFSGLTHTLLGDGSAFLFQLPARVSLHVPKLLDHILWISQQPDAVREPDAKDWIQAVAKAKTKPSALLKQTGLDQWLHREISSISKQSRRLMLGVKGQGTVYFDNRPLKRALRGDVFRQYMKSLLQGMRGCRPEEKKEWTAMVMGMRRHIRFPPCNPGELTTHIAIGKAIVSTLRIPDRVPVFSSRELADVDQQSRVVFGLPLLKLSSLLAGLSWASFFFPLILLVSGVFVFGEERRWRWRLFGLCALSAGMMPLMLVGTVQGLLVRELTNSPWFWELWSGYSLWSNHAQKLFIQEFLPLLNELVLPFFSAVSEISLWVCGLGVVCILVSFAVSEPKKEGQPLPPALS